MGDEVPAFRPGIAAGTAPGLVSAAKSKTTLLAQRKDSVQGREPRQRRCGIQGGHRASDGG